MGDGDLILLKPATKQSFCSKCHKMGLDIIILTSLLLALVIFIILDVAHRSNVSTEGPDNWSALFPDACSGRYQSPIDIRTAETVYDPDLKDFSIFYDPPAPGSKFFVHNNGHTVQVDTVGKFHVSNGGLQFIYNTAQFHFHWGHKKHHGSEHTIDGKAAPIEMHIVSWNSDKYKSISEAATEPEGLAVLGILFEVSTQDNPILEPIVNAVKKIRDPDVKTKYEIAAVPMRHYLPKAPERYYRYNGSLTTPGCFESVVWTVFSQKQTISRRQLLVFRQILKPKKHHKRSMDHADRAKREVLSELGIADDPKALQEFQENLENKNAKVDTMVEQPVSESNGTKAHHGHHDHVPKAEPKASNVDHGPAYSTNNAAPTRHNLVNNFRPVQPLNGRVVYRSFPFFDAPIENVRTVYVEIEKAPSETRELNGSSMLSFSFLTMLSVILTKFFL